MPRPSMARASPPPTYGSHRRRPRGRAAALARDRRRTPPGCPDVQYAEAAQMLNRVAPCAGQLSHVVVRQLPMAEAVERAPVRPGAVRPDLHRRRVVLRERLPHGSEVGGQRRRVCSDLVCDVLDTKESVQVVRAAGVHVGRIDVHDARPCDRHAGALQHVSLDRGVGDVLRLRARAGLDLNQVVGAIDVAAEHVHPRPYALEGERSSKSEGIDLSCMARAVLATACACRSYRSSMSTPPGKRCLASSPTSVPESRIACAAGSGGSARWRE